MKQIARKLNLGSLGTFVLIWQHNNSKQLGLLPKKYKSSIQKIDCDFHLGTFMHKVTKRCKNIFSYQTSVFKSYQQFPSGRTLQNISNPLWTMARYKNHDLWGKIWWKRHTCVHKYKCQFSYWVSKTMGQNQIEFWLKVNPTNNPLKHHSFQRYLYWHRKLTFKVSFWYFLRACHYAYIQNRKISFDYLKVASSNAWH
jgi:hypothetical protein